MVMESKFTLVKSPFFHHHISTSLKLRDVSQHLPFWRSYHLRNKNLVRYKWNDCAWNYLYTYRRRCINCHYGKRYSFYIDCSIKKDHSSGVHAPACVDYRGIKYSKPIISIHPYSYYQHLMERAACYVQLELF